MSLFGFFGIHLFSSAGNVILHVFGGWIQSGAAAAIREVARVIGVTTAPQLTSTWFSGYYWRVAGLATLLTVPFLFAAALQALVRSDLALLGRAAFGYLPLAMIGVGIASPITMLLLSATDEMSAAVSGLAVGGGSNFLGQLAVGFVAVGDPFYMVLAALITVGAALTLAVELLIREAAVYIVVLMLPLAFAAMVWPARRILVVRLIELLVALILSKFAIVAVLSLAGAAYGHSGLSGVSRMLLAMSLLLLAAFAPWTMLRLLPFTELAAGAAGALSREFHGQLPQSAAQPHRLVHKEDVAAAIASRMRVEAPTDGAEPPDPGPAEPLASPMPAPGSGWRAPGAAPVSGAAPVPGAPPERAPSTRGPSAGGKRLPDMGPIWQAANGEWPELRLGPDGFGGPTEWVPPPDDQGEPEPDPEPEPEPEPRP